ncbi:hypothetical protein SVIOM342S_09618 [Streptomyces violaceorubidus]
MSQDIARPMVPVGAMTDAWELRKPFFSPRRSTSCQASVAAAQIGVSRSSMRTALAFSSECCFMTRRCGLALRA